MSDDDEVDYYLHECPRCFYSWSEELQPCEELSGIGPILKECEWCVAHPLCTQDSAMEYSRDLLARRIEVMPKSFAKHVPEILRHLYELVKFREWDD